MSRTIQADGRTIQVPDDATDEEINQLVGPAPTANTPNTPPARLGFLDHLQKAVDLAASPQTLEANQPQAPQRIASGMVQSVLQPLVHPIQALKSIASDPMSLIEPGIGLGKAAASSIEEGKQIGAVPEIERLIGELGAPASLGGAVEPAMKGAGRLGSMMRESAIGDPNAAALKGLNVGPKSAKALGTIQSVEGARPFFQGGENLEDLQGKVKPAKTEIWQPYKDALDAVGDHVVNGPDGPTTVNDLEAERLQLSAINRGLKGKVPNPESVQLAQQKGLNQAQALAKEAAVKAALDPELASTGIDPKAIRKAFGQVSEVGGKLSGKSTLIEKPQPYGIGKIGSAISNIDIAHPLSVLKPLGAVGSGVRDIIAGRPLISGKLTDVALKDAFAKSGPKPDFGSVRTTGNPPPPSYLLGSGSIELPAPPEIGGTPKGYRPPPIDAGTIASRKGRLLPASIPARDLPLSSYHEIFPNQIPQGRLLDLIRESRKK